MPYSPIKVANELLRLAREDEPSRGLTPLQLIKLVYIAHGWSFVHLPEPLLNERAEAWQYGPVIPTLYHSIKQYGSRQIGSDIDGPIDPNDLDDRAKSLLAAVYKVYGKYSGVQLSNMTHMPNTPWSEAWNTHGKNAIISDESISNHYKQLAVERTA